MQAESTIKRPLVKYFALTYLIFFVLLGLTGAAMALKLPDAVAKVLQVVCAWSPTFAFLILYKKLVPGLALGAFVKRQFAGKLRPGPVLNMLALQAAVLVGILAIVAAMNKVPLSAVIQTSASVLILGFFDMLVRGPLGEEIGWRGYAQNQLQKRHSPLVSSLIVGVVWGFWHTPLWFLTAGYAGGQLVAYIAFFLIGIFSISVIITYFYNANRNLLFPIVIHQLLNYSGYVVNADGLQVMGVMSSLYLVAALALILANPKKALY